MLHLLTQHCALIPFRNVFRPVVLSRFSVLSGELQSLYESLYLASARAGIDQTREVALAQQSV
jgi:hypothetical protein